MSLIKLVAALLAAVIWIIVLFIASAIIAGLAWYLVVTLCASC